MTYRTVELTEYTGARNATGITLAILLLCSSAGAARYFEDEFSGGPLARQNEHILFGDDFESGCWQADNPSGDTSGSCREGVMWMRSQMQGPYSGIVVPAPHPVRKGAHAVRFEWRPENYRRTNATKKAMLHAPKVRESRNVERRYAFSVYLPRDGMAIDGYPMLFFQLHATPDRDRDEPWRQPITAMRIDPNGMVHCDWTFDTAPISPKNKNIVANRTSVPVSHVSKWWDRWTDVVWRVRYDPFGEGLVQVWVNGERVVDRQPVAIGYHDKAGAFPSYGLYYHTGKGDRTHWIYFDEIRIGDAKADFP